MGQVEHDAKEIGKLCVGTEAKKYRFDIPSYQRGYRWEESHITKLLDDIYEFDEDKKAGKPVGEYYCLQPIALKRRTDLDDENFESYEVIDGQQRLISLYILLRALKYDLDQGVFRITFERDRRDRPSTDQQKREDFLKNITQQDGSNLSKADYHYMYHAYKAAVEWLKERTTEVGKPVNRTMEVAITNDTKVIWYEIDVKTSVHDAAREMFRHINDGKIALTDSELIKASLLNSRRENNVNLKNEENVRITKTNQTGIANIWDEIERTLHNEQFWAFVSKTNNDNHTRIDFIFELIYRRAKQKKPSEEIKDGAIFSFFEKILENADSADAVWKDAREYYRIFCDWFDDITIYNYIGYIMRYINTDKDNNILTLIEFYNNHTKAAFSSELQRIIEKHSETTKENFEGLSYSSDYDKVVNLLLRANIESSNKMGRRFNFVTKGGWSVEHVFAQKSDNIKPEKRIAWLNGYSSVITRVMRTNTESREDLEKLKTDIDDFVNKNVGDFDSIFEEILKTIECKGVVDRDSIKNLALIGKDDNAALSNFAFYEKRKKIIEMSETGKNIPPETLNLFMKFHSGESTNLDYWSDDDGKAYLNRIEKLLGLDKKDEKV
jgi:uncharacterized protein with ParB-like and HNH nuclease domain